MAATASTKTILIRRPGSVPKAVQSRLTTQLAAYRRAGAFQKKVARPKREVH